MADYINAIIISNIIPNVTEIDGLAISDGTNVLITLRHSRSGDTISDLKVSEIQIDDETLERLRALVQDPM